MLKQAVSKLVNIFLSLNLSKSAGVKPKSCSVFYLMFFSKERGRMILKLRVMKRVSVQSVWWTVFEIHMHCLKTLYILSIRITCERVNSMVLSEEGFK
jgi:hypothetical protein